MVGRRLGKTLLDILSPVGFCAKAGGAAVRQLRLVGTATLKAQLHCPGGGEKVEDWMRLE